LPGYSEAGIAKYLKLVWLGQELTPLAPTLHGMIKAEYCMASGWGQFLQLPSDFQSMAPSKELCDEVDRVYKCFLLMANKT